MEGLIEILNDVFGRFNTDGQAHEIVLYPETGAVFRGEVAMGSHGRVERHRVNVAQ
jgi:hypothetical protein